jgi:hypothetical protein
MVLLFGKLDRLSLLGWVCFVMVLSPVQAQVDISFPEKSDAEIRKERTNDNVNLGGLWEAEITQLTWQGEPRLQDMSGKLHVEMTQKGNKIEGLMVCRAKYANEQGYLSFEKSFSGIWNGQNLIYQDEQMLSYINTHRTLRHIESCMKNATLDFYRVGNKMHLKGKWQGVGHISEVPCSPGMIHLTRVDDLSMESEVATTYNVSFAQKNKGPVELVWSDDNQIKKIKNRKVKKGEVIEVQSKTLSITVYDHQKDDGDIISLNYNGNYILEKFTLKNEKHKVDVILDGDKAVPNYLILYAHNLGEISPNTVAVIVDDGVTQQRFILNADMKTSDVIYFKQI